MLNAKQLVILILCLGARIAVAQEDENRELCARLQKQFDVEFLLSAEGVHTPSWPNLKCDYAGTGDQTQLNRFLKIFAAEFSKYPTQFVKKSGLKQVVFVKSMKLGKVERKAVPDYYQETLYFDFTMYARGEYPRRVVHHEYYHMIEEEFNGNSYYKDPAWAAMNESKFEYGNGGASARDPKGSVINHPRAGFVNGYSTSGLEEDKAEVWGVLFVRQNWSKVKPWLDDDPILKNKVDYMKRFAMGVVPSMNAAFWDNIHSKQSSGPKP